MPLIELDGIPVPALPQPAKPTEASDHQIRLDMEFRALWDQVKR